MAAPEYVPVDTSRAPRAYSSPPRRAESWLPDRAGEVVEHGQPSGRMLGNQGPDLGYALKLASSFRDRVILADGEHLDDVMAGGLQVAMKRASLFGRAPVIHDLTVAFTIWGFLSEDPPADLVELRRLLFAEVAHDHHYAERRRIADLVPDEVLRRPLSRLDATVASDWRKLIAVDAVDAVDADT